MEGPLMLIKVGQTTSINMLTTKPALFKINIINFTTAILAEISHYALHAALI